MKKYQGDTMILNSDTERTSEVYVSELIKVPHTSVTIVSNYYMIGSGGGTKIVPLVT